MRLITAPLVFIAACAAAGALQAQMPPRLVRGRVVSLEDGRPLAGALVAPLNPGRSPAVQTDPGGRFSLPTSAETIQLLVARIGFCPDTVALVPPQSEIEIALRPAALRLDPVLVSIATAAAGSGDRVVRALDFELRPRESAQELLRLTPGLVIAQHAGGGKAEQLFLRGFDADHGTDVAVSVDGTPVNLVSHAHGQGYADLHFLIPEVVEGMTVRKGPYDARDGNLATAGAVALRTRDRFPSAWAVARGGSFGTGRLAGATPFGGDAAATGGYIAWSAQASDGPFLHEQDHRRGSLFARVTAPVSRVIELDGTLSAYGAGWAASGQIPARAVAAGVIPRFGAIDSTEGGATHRYEAAVMLRGREPETPWQVRGYLVRYDLDLFSNFTFFLRDTLNGDGIEQRDGRWLAGVAASHERAATLLGHDARVAVGGSVRADIADVQLGAQRQRARLGTLLAHRLHELNSGVWAGAVFPLGPRILLDVGLRGDLFRFAVRELDGPHDLGRPAPRERSLIQARLSPKLSLTAELDGRMAVFAKAGVGFHTNDARLVVFTGDATSAIAQAAGAELGARRSWTGGTLALAVWGLDLSSELVFVGDDGLVEPSGRTRRVGIDLEGRVRITPWLWADGDLSLARGRFRNADPGAERIPLAPTLTTTAGLTLRDAGPVVAALRMRRVGDRPADESGAIAARGHTLMELAASYRWRCLAATVAVDNLLGTAWNEAQFATTSRLQGEAEPVKDLHFTPGAPRAISVGVRVGCR